MTKEKKIKTLKQKVAIKLWLQGKDAWNAWVEKNSVYNIDFSGVDFSEYRNSDNDEIISFLKFKFPKGIIDFSHASFGVGDVDFSHSIFDEGDVNFSHTQFGSGELNFYNALFREGSVDFSNANFGKGEANFSHTSFGKGDVNFSYTEFGKGDIFFSNALFGEGDVNFYYAAFGEGDVYFSHVAFGEGDVYFSHAIFGEGSVNFSRSSFDEGDVNFSRAEFNKGNVNFSHVSFGDGDVYFLYAIFNEGDVNFSRAEFGEGNIFFSHAQFGQSSLYFFHTSLGKGKYLFEKVTFNAPVFFPDLRTTENVISFSFKHSVFNDSLKISAEQPFGCIIDLTSTKMYKQVSLSGIECALKIENPRSKIADKLIKKWGWEWITRAQATDKEDAERARRLKEIASDNKSCQQALTFHALEMKAERKPMPFILFFLETEFWYQKCSDYGRSTLRPLIAMCTIWLLSSLIYLYIANGSDYDFRMRFLASSIYSGTQMFSFIPSNHEATKEMLHILFENAPPPWIYIITFFQTILSLVFLFLIGLGLRNKFRI